MWLTHGLEYDEKENFKTNNKQSALLSIFYSYLLGKIIGGSIQFLLSLASY